MDQNNSIEWIYVNVDFGKIPIGTKKCNHFDLATHFPEIPDFPTIQSSSSIYNMFELRQTGSQIKITYKPKIPNTRNIEIYDLFEIEGILYKISAKGECFGPKVHFSTKYLEFKATSSRPSVKKSFQIMNQSEIAVLFQFEVDDANEGGIFQVSPIKGTLAPMKNLIVTVNFAPKKQGMWSRKMNCLIQHHAPKSVELFGINSNKMTKETTFIKYFENSESISGFSAYFRSDLHVDLDKHYIDFGRVTNCEIVQVESKLLNEIAIEWSEGDVFRIKPHTAAILGGQAESFRVTFNAPETNKLFSAQLVGQVHWKSDEDEGTSVHVPLNITLSCIGNSFPIGESYLNCVDIAQKIIIFPPTLPNHYSFASVFVECNSELPILFKLIPPKRTDIVTRPMLGLIKKYQIIYAQLKTDGINKSFTEKWAFQMNGLEEKQITLCFSGAADVPAVVLNQNNIVDFGIVQLNSDQVMSVPLQNVSLLKLKIEFKPNPYLRIVLINDELYPNETIFITISYTGTFESPNLFDLKCILYAMEEDSIIGAPFGAQFLIRAECAYSELCAIPSSQSFGPILCDAEIRTEFYAYNFGLSPVDFLLDWPIEEFIIEPQSGVVPPRSYVKIGINGRAATRGFHQITIKYRQFKANDADEAINLFQLNYSSFYPTIQIKEIVYFNFAFIYTKMDMWDFFRIDQFNTLLRDLEKFESENLAIELPCLAMSEKVYSIEFLVENTTNSDCCASLKRKKMCDCELVEIKQFCSRKKTFECPHRECLEMFLTDPIIYANKTQVLTVNFKYIFPETTQMSYNLTLPNNRSLEISFFITTILPSIKYLDHQGMNYELKLNDVFIGEKEAPVQFYWLINNTEHIIGYELNADNIAKLCSEEDFPVLVCGNGKGFVQPFASEHISIRFHPIEEKLYEVSLPLTLGDHSKELLICANGTMQRSEKNFYKKRNRMPISSTATSSQCPVRLSFDSIEIGPFPTLSTVTKLLFIENTSNDTVFEYSWGQLVIGNYIAIEITRNMSGILRPKERQYVEMTIKSFKLPLIAEKELACKLVNCTARDSYDAAWDEYQKRRAIQLQEFEINEEATVQTEVEEFTMTSPNDVYLTLHASIIVVANGNLPVESQFAKQMPFNNEMLNPEAVLFEYMNEMRCNNKRCTFMFGEKLSMSEKSLLKSVMECLIADVVFDGKFMECLKLAVKSPSPYYSQIQLSDKSTNGDVELDVCERETRKYLNQPQITELASIFHKLSFDSLLNTFKIPFSKERELNDDE